MGLRGVTNIGPLINYILANVNIHSDCLFSELITKEGTWNLDLLQVWLPEDLIRHIVGIPPPHPSEGLNRLSWRHTSTGAFSIKSAYKKMKEDSWNSRDEIWKKTWKLTRPQREVGLSSILMVLFKRNQGMQLLGELYAMKMGTSGHDKVIIQSDNLEVTKDIHRSASKISNSALVRRIHHILSQEGQWILRHIPREHNRSSDYLAKLAFAEKEDLKLICTPPREVLEFLKADKERSIRIP
ncbi:hypothetical protein Goari_004846 [Gossypium aridum]|uniref:RNase H type-1 domain-containing protein n=1 Tax=Gossypium aridum TaxID=34290 RepID=A0A7J8Y4Q5_GOSAI|nr:hypothetical protein [Gossypium aridum]